MTIREQIEQMQAETLSEFATLDQNSRGRDVEEPQCDIRPVFQRDRDRILHSKSFRRLKNKTQVFLDPQGDHYRTRMSHTLEVSQNARTIAKALRMNEDLVEAIALGHDLGHTPFGHCGERVLNRMSSEGFIHAEQSVRVVEKLEQEGRGLNLTWEVRDGMRNHRTSGHPATPEGQIVRLADKIAYINSDVDDAIRGKIMAEESLPKEIRNTLGTSVKARLDRLIHDVIINSTGSPEIRMSTEVDEAMKELRSWLFTNVYTNPVAKGEETKASRMIEELYRYYMDNSNALPDRYRGMYMDEGEPLERVVCDYISGMTDSFACKTFNEIFIPISWEEY